MFLGLKVGDRGVVRFFDRSVEEYKKGNEDETGDPRLHSFSDGLFEVGFLPTTESYSFPSDKTVEIGNKNGSFKVSFAEDGGITIETEKNLSITCLNASITADKVDLAGTGGKKIARDGDEVYSGSVLIGTIKASSTKVSSL